MRFHVGFSFGFKQIKKLIIPILIAVAVFFGLKKADASTFVDIKNFQLPTAFIPYDCSSPTTCNTSRISSYSKLVNVDRYAYTIQDDVTIGQSGINMTYQVNQSLTKGYLYSMSTLYCSDISNVKATTYTGSTSANSKFSSMNYSKTVLTSVSAFDVIYSNENASYIAGEDNQYCYIINSVFSPNTDGQWVSLHLQRDSLSGGSRQYLYGYQLENLGLYSEDLVNDISSIINNSNETLLNGFNNSVDGQTNVIQQNQQQTMGKLNELKDKFEDMFLSCRPSVNLFDFPNFTYSSGGITHTINNQSFTSIGTATSTSSDIGNSSNVFQLSQNLISGKTYTFSRTVANPYRLYIRLYTSDMSSYEQFMIGANSKSVTFTVNSDKKYFYLFYAGWTSGNSINISNYNLQLQEGSSATAYEEPGKVCENRMDATNDKLDNIENTITDDSIDDNSGFFTDFEENDFGLSDIVKAPLILIRGLSNGGTCQDLQFNVLGADVLLPSGCILWDKVPDSIETIYNIFIGGFFAYILCTKLFHDVNDLKDPQKNEVSTLDL